MVTAQESVASLPLVERGRFLAPSPWIKGALRLVPGVALLLALGYSGKLIERFIQVYGKSHALALPNIEYVLWAILFGLVIGNACAGFKWFAIFGPGISTYDSFSRWGLRYWGCGFCSPTCSGSGGSASVSSSSNSVWRL